MECLAGVAYVLAHSNRQFAGVRDLTEAWFDWILL
jgi:hypothetical protein